MYFWQIGKGVEPLGGFKGWKAVGYNQRPKNLGKDGRNEMINSNGKRILQFKISGDTVPIIALSKLYYSE